MEPKIERIGQNNLLSTRRVDNLVFCFRGRIIEPYYRSKIQ